MATGHICCCIDCSTVGARVRRQLPSICGMQHFLMPALNAEARLPYGLGGVMEEGLTNNSKREAIPKGSHLIIGAPTVDLEYGHANELREQGRPQPPAVLVRLQMHNDVTCPGTCKA